MPLSGTGLVGLLSTFPPSTLIPKQQLHAQPKPSDTQQQSENKNTTALSSRQVACLPRSSTFHYFHAHSTSKYLFLARKRQHKRATQLTIATGNTRDNQLCCCTRVLQRTAACSFQIFASPLLTISEKSLLNGLRVFLP